MSNERPRNEPASAHEKGSEKHEQPTDTSYIDWAETGGYNPPAEKIEKDASDLDAVRSRLLGKSTENNNDQPSTGEAIPPPIEATIESGATTPENMTAEQLRVLIAQKKEELLRLQTSETSIMEEATELARLAVEAARTVLTPHFHRSPENVGLETILSERDRGNWSDADFVSQLDIQDKVMTNIDPTVRDRIAAYSEQLRQVRKPMRETEREIRKLEGELSEKTS